MGSWLCPRTYNSTSGTPGQAGEPGLKRLLTDEEGPCLREGPAGRGGRWWAHVRPCVPSISITTSCYPLPSICVRDPVSDWFESLAQCLHWNVRKRQAHFTDEEGEEES